jgi:hypothetical protein
MIWVHGADWPRGIPNFDFLLGQNALKNDSDRFYRLIKKTIENQVNIMSTTAKDQRSGKSQGVAPNAPESALALSPLHVNHDAHYF